MASGLYIDKDDYEDFYLDLDDVDEAAKDESNLSANIKNTLR